MKTIKDLWKLMEQKRALFILAVLSVFIGMSMSLSVPMFISVTVDTVLGGAELQGNALMRWFVESVGGGVEHLRSNIWICALAVAVVSAVQGLMFSFRMRSLTNIGESFVKKMKDSLYDHIQKLPYDYHTKAQTGDLIQRCTSDVETVRRFMAGQSVEMVRSMTILLFALFIMLTINVKMALMASAMVPFIFAFSFIYFTSVKKAFKLQDEKEGELSTVLQENLTGVRVVRAFSRQQYEMEKFSAKNAEFRDLQFKVTHMLALYWSLSNVMCLAQIVITAVAGVIMTNRGELSIGGFMMFVSYGWQMVWPVRHMGRLLSDLGKMQVSLGRINEVMDTKEEAETEGATEADLRGDIVFDNVSFWYDSDKPVLKKMSFTIKQGETIAVLGSTGSGKSSIMHLLLRLYDYKEGSVTINGTELRQIKKSWLRERIGLVLQEPFLFSKTIRNNLKMAKRNVKEDEIVAATRTAAVHDVIEDFEKGYETMIGEKGVTLSGGQKQRVAIARTLIKNSDVLIFDDSLSAVDTQTDAQIRAALKERENSATTIIISQRITTLMQADRIFVMENGTLSAVGTHDELVAQDGLYSRIWNIQSMLEDDFMNEESEVALP